MVIESECSRVVVAGVEVPLVGGGSARYINLDYAASATGAGRGLG